MVAIEQSPETRGAGKPSYVVLAEYIFKHIDDKKPLTKSFLIKHFHVTPTMVQYCLNGLPSVASNRRGLHLSEGSSVLTLLEEVEMAQRKAGNRNYTKTAIDRQTPSHLPVASIGHWR